MKKAVQQIMLGTVCKTDEDIIHYAKKLQEMGAVNVLISMAGDGAILITEDGQNISDEIKKQGIEAVIIHVPIWATPSLAFRIAYGTSYPVLLLGNLQRNTSSLVTLLAVGGMLDQTGKKCIRVSGDYEDPQIQEKVFMWQKASAVPAME